MPEHERCWCGATDVHRRHDGTFGEGHANCARAYANGLRSILEEVLPRRRAAIEAEITEAERGGGT